MPLGTPNQFFECVNIGPAEWVVRERASKIVYSSHVSFGSAFHQLEIYEKAKDNLILMARKLRK